MSICPQFIDNLKDINTFYGRVKKLLMKKNNRFIEVFI